MPAPAVIPGFVEGVFDLAKQAAAVADAYEAENELIRKQAAQLRAENERLKSSTPVSVKEAGEWAGFLEREGLLPAGTTAMKAASEIARNPGGLINTLLRVIAPVPPEGTAVKTASTSSGQADLEDRDGWLEAIS